MNATVMRWATAVLAAVVGGNLCRAVADTLDVSLPPFYEAAARLPATGKLGQVLAKESVPTAIEGAQAWRIAYVSSDLKERRTISTALVVAPRGAALAAGRPIVAWAHGTTGTAQNCGPSQVVDPAQPLNQYFLVGGNSWSDYGLPAVAHFIRQGYVVVGTDYHGLGGGGAHQYAVAATQARDVLNSVRAAGAMNLAGPKTIAVDYGWSQGGGAAIAAASLADYIAQKGTAYDDVAYAGFVAMAPDDVAAMAPKGALDKAAAEKLFASLTASFTDNVFNFAHFAMNLWASPAAFPDLMLTEVFTDEGAAVVDEVMRKKCVHVAADTLNYTYGENFKSLLRPVPRNALAWAQAFIDGSVAAVKPVAPVVIYWGTKDTAVPPLMGKLYRKQMCALGGNVARVQLAGEQTHFSTPGAAEPLYKPWISDRFEGKPIANGCAGAAG